MERLSISPSWCPLPPRATQAVQSEPSYRGLTKPTVAGGWRRLAVRLGDVRVQGT